MPYLNTPPQGLDSCSRNILELVHGIEGGDVPGHVLTYSSHKLCEPAKLFFAYPSDDDDRRMMEIEEVPPT